jgi:hypothetical protein
VATVWKERASPRSIDAPALAGPAGLRRWLGRLTVAQRQGLESRVMTQVLFGERVLVLARRGRWDKVRVPLQRGSVFREGIVGWVPRRQLSVVAPPAGAGEVVVTASTAWLEVIRGRGLGSRRPVLSYATTLPLLGARGGLLLVGLPGGGEGVLRSRAAGAAGASTPSGPAIVADARRFLGLPYVWGGTSAFGYDCSGLVYALFARYGRILPRDAADQRRVGRPIALRAARPGDLLFFAGRGGRGPIHHVAIYAGRGVMIDAPYAGAAVEAVALRSSPIWDEFVGATRVTTRR